MVRDVVILGRGPSCYLSDGNRIKEVWCSQSTYDYIKLQRTKKTITKVFRLHPHELEEPDNKYGLTLSFEFIPINKLRQVFGDMFHSSAAWMLGTAVLTGFNSITMYGIDLVNRVERGSQRDGLFRMVGIAEAMGIQINVPVNSGMYLHPQLYGLQDFIVKLDNELLIGDKK